MDPDGDDPRLLRSRIPPRGPPLPGLLACVGLLGALTFLPTLQYLVFVWSTDDNYSHGFLVPLIAATSPTRPPAAARSRPGAGWCRACCCWRLDPRPDWRRSWCRSGSSATGPSPGPGGDRLAPAGPAALRRFGFALAFLVFMIPLPVALYSMIASPLQLLVSRLAAALLNAAGIPVLCEGTIMTLPGDVRMFVAEACSGMRQLTGFLALTTAVAYLSARPAWYRALVVASVDPVALTANVVRVTLTGVIMSHRPEVRLGAFHTAEGLLMMGFGLALLGAECWLLNRLAEPLRRRARRRRPRSPALGTEAGGAAMSPADAAALAALDPGRAALARPGGAEAATRDRPARTAGGPWTIPPCGLGNWVGARRADRPGDPRGVAGRRPPEPRLRGHRGPRGGPSGSGSTTRSTGLNLRHSPEVCLPSGGWTKVESQCQVMPIAPRAGATLPADRGWRTRKVNWSRGSGSGTTSSAKGGLERLRPDPADHQPEQPRPDDPRLGPDRRGVLPGEPTPTARPWRTSPPPWSPPSEPILPDGPGRVSHPLSERPIARGRRPDRHDGQRKDDSR